MVKCKCGVQLYEKDEVKFEMDPIKNNCELISKTYRCPKCFITKTVTQ